MTKNQKNELISEGIKFAESVCQYFKTSGDNPDGIKPFMEYIDAKANLTKEEQVAFDVGFLHHGSEAEAKKFKAWSQRFFNGYGV